MLARVRRVDTIGMTTFTRVPNLTFNGIPKIYKKYNVNIKKSGNIIMKRNGNLNIISGKVNIN